MKYINFEKTFFYIVLAFAFVLPISRALVTLFIILLPFVWIIEGDFRNKFQKIQKKKIFLPLFGFFLLSIFSLLWSSDYDVAKNELRILSYFFALFIIATSLKQRYINTIITAFLSGMFISEIIAYGVFFELWTFKNATPQDPSPFMSHIEYSIFLAFTSILLLNRLFSKEYFFKEKILLLFFFLTVTGNLFITQGRTGQVAYVVAIITMTVLHFKITFKSLILALLLLSSIFGTAYSFSSNFHNRVTHTQDEITSILKGELNSSWGIRVGFWITTFHILEKDPLLGVGIGDYKLAQKQEIDTGNYKYLSEHTKEFISHNHPHNQYLLVLLETGIIGLILFLSFFYKYFKLNIQNRELKQLSIIFGVIYSVGFLSEPLLIKQFTLSLFILFFGLFILLENPKTI